MTEPSVARLFSWQELMLEQERLSCDPAHAARAEEFREGNEQMDRQEEQIAHELKLSRRPICTRLHHSGDSRQHLPIRHPQAGNRAAPQTRPSYEISFGAWRQRTAYGANGGSKPSLQGLGFRSL